METNTLPTYRIHTLRLAQGMGRGGANAHIIFDGADKVVGGFANLRNAKAELKRLQGVR